MFIFKKTRNSRAVLSILKHQTSKANTLITAEQQNKEIQKLSKFEKQKRALNFSIITKLYQKINSFKALILLMSYI